MPLTSTDESDPTTVFLSLVSFAMGLVVAAWPLIVAAWSRIF